MSRVSGVKVRIGVSLRIRVKLSFSDRVGVQYFPTWSEWSYMSGSRRVGTALKLLTFEFVLRKVVKLQLPFFYIHRTGLCLCFGVFLCPLVGLLTGLLEYLRINLHDIYL